MIRLIDLKPLIILLLFGLTVACSDTKLRPLTENAIILAFGDSLTFGIGSNNNQTYPAQLQKLSGLSVINAGISGETSEQGLRRFQQVIDRYSPQLIILLEGGNDILKNYNKQLIKHNLASMIEIAQSQLIDVILIGVPEKKLFSNSADLYRELAEQYNLVLEDKLLSDLLHTAKYKSDPIHLNNAGYQQLANGIYQLLKKQGAIN